MASNKGKMPEVLFVAPIGCPRDKVRHKHALFYVEECDDLGRPLVLRMLHNEDQAYKVDKNGLMFMTAYVQEQMTRPNPKYRNHKSPPLEEA